MSEIPTVAVLAGGPDAEREVSLRGADAAVRALNDSGEFAAQRVVIDRLTLDDLRAIPGEIIWPLLHGPWGEGGPMQDLLDAAGRPYVGSRPAAARLAMDKHATKLAAERASVFAPEGVMFDPADANPPVPFPLVVKPNREGSTIGLHICETPAEWNAAHRATAQSGRPAIVEPFIRGRELAASILDNGDGLAALPLVEITPKDGLYDYDAKYVRNDTLYTLEPDIEFELTHEVQRRALAVAHAVGVRHLARADFILPHKPNHLGEIEPVLLEINTMPGFTDHSLLPMAAAHIGLPMPALCASLARCALRDHATTTAV